MKRKIYFAVENANGKIKVHLPERISQLNIEFSEVKEGKASGLYVWLRGYKKLAVKKRAAKLFNYYRNMEIVESDHFE
jgi:hypothetical protein